MKVIVSLEDAVASNREELAKLKRRLQQEGMQISQRHSDLENVGMITGEIDEGKIAGLRKVAGVEGVEVDSQRKAI